MQHNKSYPLLNRHPEIKDLFVAFEELIQKTQRPANETILYDEHVMRILGICKRKLQTMRSKKMIPYIDPPGQRVYYLLSDILNWLNKYRVESIENQRKI